MAAAFSRLQLAAALLEYDNDPTNPIAPYRSAHESAIFAPLRRNPTPASRGSDYLSVALPSETGSLGGRESALDGRRSRGSIDALRNPFGADDEDDNEVEEGMEVDLASWGLDAFMPKDKASRNGKGKAKSDALPNPHPPSSLRVNNAQKRTMGNRAMSVGFGEGGAFLEAGSSSRPPGARRRSIGSPLDLASMDIIPNAFHPRPRSEHTLIEALASAPPLHSVPFPTGDTVRSPSPRLNESKQERPSSRASLLDSRPREHNRTHSVASLDSRLLTKEGVVSEALRADDNPFALRPPSNASRFDPKAAAHARTVSNASLGSRMLLENDGISVMTGRQTVRDRPYSTLELLRPKVLVMPSPLQPISKPIAALPIKAGEGFQLSTDGPPLPPGARSSRKSSATMSFIEPSSSPSAPIASNSFTPNPRLNLSLSQLTFRNTLMVGGQRDIAYSDIDSSLPRATEEGEQIRIAPVPEGEASLISQIEVVDTETSMKPGRPAGKLFGKSLIDDLENRKAMIRSKQRVFTGDERPSMMARGKPQRSGTLIDPASLNMRPNSQRLSSYDSQPALGRRNSANIKPLLTFHSESQIASPDLPSDRIPNSRSVFGVDTLWEREMLKLEEIEAREKAEAAERKRQEEEAEAKESKRQARKKGKGKSKAAAVDDPGYVEAQSQPRVSAEPPVLPTIEKPIRRPPPQFDDDESESDSDAPRAGLRETVPDADADRWVAGSSDEEDNGPRRTTGTGPRYASPARRHVPADDDSEEDVPLAATVSRAFQRAIQLGHSQDDSEDEGKPLSALLQAKSQQSQRSLPSINFDNDSSQQRSDDDDDQPLGLRASRIPSQMLGSFQQAGDEDDTPLAFHPEQQRRTHYQMIAQQQQQQQMMMQAHMQNSMFFGAPPIVNPAFFGTPPMMMPSPIPMPSPPPMHDAAKYGAVDRWRRDVVVEGEP